MRNAIAGILPLPRTLMRAAVWTALSASFIQCACGRENRGKPPLVPQVTVVQPSVETVTDYLEFTGNAQASDTVQLQARVSGFLTNVAFKDGDVVKQGDLLFQIEPDTYAAKVALNQAALAGAEAELLRASLEYSRQAELVKQRAVAVQDVEKARAQRDTAQARLDEKKSDLKLAEIQFEYTRITAPFDGRVDRRLKDPGNLVGVGEPTLLTTIYRMNPIYVYFSINEKDLVKVRRPPKQGETPRPLVFAGIEGEEGYPHEGLIDFSSSGLDSSTGTLLLRASFDNPPFGMLPKILPGMFVRLRVPVNRRNNAVLVPDPALGVDQEGRFVLTVNADNVVQKMPVKAGALFGGLRVIEEGLNGKEAVVVGGLHQARPGSKVNPVQQHNAAPQGQ